MLAKSADEGEGPLERQRGVDAFAEHGHGCVSVYSDCLMFERNRTGLSGALSTVRRTLAATVDAILEVSVIGIQPHRAGGARAAVRVVLPEPGALTGRTALVTGPTSGLGLAATWVLADLGARVILVGRSSSRLERLREALVGGTSVRPLSRGRRRPRVAGVCRGRRSTGFWRPSPLDVLIDNAGAIHAARSESPNGIESTLAILVVGPFALEHGLEPLLRQTPGSRVIAVTSGGMYAQRLPLDDLQFAGGDYDGTRAYARAKRAQVALMRRVVAAESRIVAFAAMHPGWADTPGLAEALPGFHRVMRPLLRSTAQGIDTIVWLATHPDAAAIDGGLYLDRRRGRSTASVRPGSRRAIAGACGTSWPGSQNPGLGARRLGLPARGLVIAEARPVSVAERPPRPRSRRHRRRDRASARRPFPHPTRCPRPPPRRRRLVARGARAAPRRHRLPPPGRHR